MPKADTPYPSHEVNELPERETWYKGNIQFRDVLYAVSMISVALLFLFQKQSDVHDISLRLATYEKVQDQLAATVAAQQQLINSNATAMQLQIASNIERDKRINEAQAQLSLLVPDVREIRTKLNFVADMLDQRSKQKP